MTCIYKITAPNGKSYIGQNVMSVKTRFQLRGDKISLSLSVYGLKSRMKHHQKERSNCTLLKRSILKYGWENMKVEVLLYCEEKHLNFYEKQMILAWDTLAPRGLNCTSGGEAGKRLSMETRNKIASGMKKAHAEGRAAVGQAGHIRTEESKRKQSEKMKALCNGKDFVSEEKREERRRNASGTVSKSTSGKFRAIIPAGWNKNKKKGYLGSFDTKEEALQAIANYKKEHVN